MSQNLLRSYLSPTSDLHFSTASWLPRYSNRCVLMFGVWTASRDSSDHICLKICICHRLWSICIGQLPSYRHCTSSYEYTLQESCLAPLWNSTGSTNNIDMNNLEVAACNSVLWIHFLWLRICVCKFLPSCLVIAQNSICNNSTICMMLESFTCKLWLCWNRIYMYWCVCIYQGYRLAPRRN